MVRTDSPGVHVLSPVALPVSETQPRRSHPGNPVSKADGGLSKACIKTTDLSFRSFVLCFVFFCPDPFQDQEILPCRRPQAAAEPNFLLSHPDEMRNSWGHHLARFSNEPEEPLHNQPSPADITRTGFSFSRDHLVPASFVSSRSPEAPVPPDTELRARLDTAQPSLL